LLKALAMIAVPGLAVDLGCGSGIDTMALLHRGWRVLAIDRGTQALAWLERNVRPEWLPYLEMQQEAFEAVALPACDLVNASFSLPFCISQRRSLSYGGRL
jgi:methylase of polypeptide subunit release factors